LLVFTLVFAATRDGGWWRRVALPALFYGIALWAKASTLVFGVLVMLALEAERCWRLCGDSPDPRIRLRQTIRRLLSRPFIAQTPQIVSLGFLFVLVVCGSDWRREPSFVKWAAALPDGPFAATMTRAAEHLRIFNNAGVAIVRQIKHNMQGHGSYILGHSAPRALWYYFPVALTIKLTLTLLALPI